MKNSFLLIFFFLSYSSKGQVQRITDGESNIRAHIIKYTEFNFFRDWTNIATFKSGIGESVQVFPVKFSTPDGKIYLHGLQLNAFVKKQEGVQYFVSSNLTGLVKEKKDFLYRSVFIDKEDVARMITFIERDIIPNLKTGYKRQSKEFVYKCKEMFFAFLIDEKDQRITMHIVDYGPLGDGRGGGNQIEFWTESQVDEIPKFLASIKDAYAKMK
jgi:hypothetical protein